MCAICGIVNFDHSEPVDPVLIEKMTQTLVHRGPDDEGHFVEGPAAQYYRSG